MEKEEKIERISNPTAGLMLGTAVFFDMAQWLLSFIVMGWLVNIFAIFTFFLWFALHGVNFFKRNPLKKLGWISVVALIKLIPVLGAWIVVGWSGTVLRIIYMVKSEDKKRNEEIELAEKKSARRRQGEAARVRAQGLSPLQQAS
jgi:hypothetical protein